VSLEADSGYLYLLRPARGAAVINDTKGQDSSMDLEIEANPRFFAQPPPQALLPPPDESLASVSLRKQPPCGVEAYHAHARRRNLRNYGLLANLETTLYSDFPMRRIPLVFDQR